VQLQRALVDRSEIVCDGDQDAPIIYNGICIKAANAFSGRGRWFGATHPGLTRAHLPAWFSGV
jgi:hypothetical protein